MEAVADDLLLVTNKVCAVGLLKSGSKGGDGVVVRSTLEPGEDGKVDLVLQVVNDVLALLVLALDTLAEEDHGAPGSSEGLVRGGRDDVRVVKGGRDELGRDQPADVRHVREKVRAGGIRNLAEATVVDQTGVGGGAAHDQLGAEELRAPSNALHVNVASLLVEPVGHALKVGAHSTDLLVGQLVPVGQVAAVGEIQSEDAVVGGQESGVDLEISRRAREALHVHTPLSGVQVEGLKCSSGWRKEKREVEKREVEKREQE